MACLPGPLCSVLPQSLPAGRQCSLAAPKVLCLHLSWLTSFNLTYRPALPCRQVELWMGEQPQYDPAKGFDPSTGHFTQVRAHPGWDGTQNPRGQRGA